MRNLLAFVIKYHFLFVFIFLQSVCFFLMVQNKSYQGSQVLNSSNALVGNVYTAAANTSEYFSLKLENDKLANENAVLRNLLKTNYSIIPLAEYEKHDTLYKQQYTYMSAKVVNSSVNKRRNYLTINIGKEQGVVKDMAIISSNGIVGYVTDVSENFSSAMSVLHKDAKVNCQLKKDGMNGLLVWPGSDYQYCSLTDIPTHAKLKKGDTIVTSELSGFFPEGLFVGTVDSWEQGQNESFFTVKVKLGADLKNKFKVERDSLENIAQKQIDD